ncbi:adenosine deaminase [Blastococcus colisei]|uniref:adenosine deaminase n=1 Tax=Blastococcus colisei TaxID=1564162 RepID=UPI0014773ACE|nr:adenosine deaminase [Blastococcus colisei]
MPTRTLSSADLVALPKAELHLHLEGAIRPETARELADRYDLPLPRTGRFTDLGEFVVAYEQARDLIGSLEDLRRVAAEILTTARENGVVWTEVHLIPPTYAGRLGPDEAVVEAVLDGLASAAGPDAAAGLIIGVNRMLPVADADRSLSLALAYRDRGVVGLGLAADEARFPASLFEDVFGRAADAGLPAVPHAGEGAGAGSVRTCVERLGARRINHGIRAAEDPAVVDLLLERGVSLDVCPTSNVELQIVPDLASHPLPRLIESGVPVSLNTDCPLFLGATTVGEYALASSAFGLEPDALAAIARTSLVTSSCPADRRERALAGVADWRPTG